MTSSNAPNGYSLHVVGAPQSGKCANCTHLFCLTGGPATQFFGEVSHATPQHGRQSACSLRETLSPTLKTILHTRTQPATLTKYTKSSVQFNRPHPHSPKATHRLHHPHLSNPQNPLTLSTIPHTHSLNS